MTCSGWQRVFLCSKIAYNITAWMLWQGRATPARSCGGSAGGGDYYKT